RRGPGRRSLGGRYRVRCEGLVLSAERGYLRETGNLVFHSALIVVIVAVAVDRLDVTFEERAGGAQRGAPRDFTAYTRTKTSPDAPEVSQTLKVNGPL